MRNRRIENEWRLLHDLAALNPGSLEIVERGVGPNEEYFRVRLNQTTGPVESRDGVGLRDSHLAGFHFPRFFPAVPIEALLMHPVFHPNVDPDTGFVCLWTRVCPGDTVAEALTRLQRVIAWDLANLTPDHVMQPRAAAWYRDTSRPIALPCAFVPLLLPKPPGDGVESRRASLRTRPRLSQPMERK